MYRNVIDLGHTTLDTYIVNYIEKYISRNTNEWGIRVHKRNGRYFDLWYKSPDERNYYYNKIRKYL